MKAIIVDAVTEEPIGEIDLGYPAQTGDLFTACQYNFGHCLGKNVDADGHTVSWIFSYCEKNGLECQVKVVKVYLED